MATAERGPNAVIYFQRRVPILFRADRPVDILNLSSVTARILVLGKYHTSRATVDLEVHGTLRDGRFEIEFPLGRLDAVLLEWEQTGSAPAEFRGIDYVVRSLTFNEATGFKTIYAIRHGFDYLLTVFVPFNPVTLHVMPSIPNYGETARFVKAVEKDDRARAILAGNKTGLPSFLAAGDAVRSIVAGYLMNSARYDFMDSRWYYTYDDDLRRLMGQPEVRRLLREDEVRKFVDAGGDVRLKGNGDDRKGFLFALTDASGRRLEARLLGRKITIAKKS